MSICDGLKYLQVQIHVTNRQIIFKLITKKNYNIVMFFNSTILV